MRWWRASAATWRGYRGFARLAWHASPALSVTAAVAVVLAAAAPLASVAAIGRLVALVPAIAAGGPHSPAAGHGLAWAVAAGGLYLLQSASVSLQAAATTALGERVDAMLQRSLMDAVLAPDGTGHLEDPATLDLVEVGRDTFRSSSTRPGRLAATLGGLAGGWLVTAGSCVILARLNPLLGAGLLLTALWSPNEDRVASRLEAAHHYGSTELSRRTGYAYQLGLTPPAAKEVRVFGLRGYLELQASAYR